MFYLRYVLMLLILIAAGTIDYIVVIVKNRGLNSGETFSWQTYADARNYPAIGFFAGYIACLLTTGPASTATLAQILMFVFIWVTGHIFGTMRGA